MDKNKTKTSNILFQKIPFNILIFLWYNQKALQLPPNQQKIARTIDVTVSATTRILNNFEKTGIISRIKKGRQNLIIITDNGMNIGNKIYEISNNLMKKK